MIKRILILLLLMPAGAIFGQEKSPLSAAEKLRLFLNITDTLRQKTNNPGMAVAVFYDHKLLLKKTYGVGSREADRAVSDSTLFQIGSLTKAFTGVVGFKLEAQGKIRWEEKVRHYLPNFQLQDKYATEQATFQDLFTHKIGIDKHYYLMYGPYLSRQEILDKLKYLSFKGSFRENFLYNNQMYVVAGLVEEKVSGRRWDDLIRSEIFGPLGMKHSFTTMADFKAYKDHTTSYAADGKAVIPNVDIDNYNAAGSISSTIGDMSSWLEMLLNKGTLNGREILSADAFSRSIMPLTIRYPDEEVFYGTGWEINTKKRTVFHSGSTAGQRSIVCFSPEQGFGVVVLTNQQTNLPNALMNYAVSIFLEGSAARNPGLDQFIVQSSKPYEKIDRVYQVRDKAALEKLKGIEGTYSHPAYGELTISKKSDFSYNFSYYDFSGTIEHQKDSRFTAHLNFFLGAEHLPFEVLPKNNKTRSIRVFMPNSAPLEFVRKSGVKP